MAWPGQPALARWINASLMSVGWAGSCRGPALPMNGKKSLLVRCARSWGSQNSLFFYGLVVRLPSQPDFFSPLPSLRFSSRLFALTWQMLENKINLAYFLHTQGQFLVLPKWSFFFLHSRFNFTLCAALLRSFWKCEIDEKTRRMAAKHINNYTHQYLWSWTVLRAPPIASGFELWLECSRDDVNAARAVIGKGWVDGLRVRLEDKLDLSLGALECDWVHEVLDEHQRIWFTLEEFV